MEHKHTKISGIPESMPIMVMNGEEIVCMDVDDLQYFFNESNRSFKVWSLSGWTEIKSITKINKKVNLIDIYDNHNSVFITDQTKILVTDKKNGKNKWAKSSEFKLPSSSISLYTKPYNKLGKYSYYGTRKADVIIAYDVGDEETAIITVCHNCRQNIYESQIFFRCRECKKYALCSDCNNLAYNELKNVALHTENHQFTKKVYFDIMIENVYDHQISKKACKKYIRIATLKRFLNDETATFYYTCLLVDNKRLPRIHVNDRCINYVIKDTTYESIKELFVYKTMDDRMHRTGETFYHMPVSAIKKKFNYGIYIKYLKKYFKKENYIRVKNPNLTEDIPVYHIETEAGHYIAGVGGIVIKC